MESHGIKSKKWIPEEWPATIKQTKTWVDQVLIEMVAAKELCNHHSQSIDTGVKKDHVHCTFWHISLPLGFSIAARLLDRRKKKTRRRTYHPSWNILLPSLHNNFLTWPFIGEVNTRQRFSFFFCNWIRHLTLINDRSGGKQLSLFRKHWNSRETKLTVSQLARLTWRNVIDFTMLRAQRFWRETVSLLDVMWPRSNQWERALLGKKFPAV